MYFGDTYFRVLQPSSSYVNVRYFAATRQYLSEQVMQITIHVLLTSYTSHDLMYTS